MCQSLSLTYLDPEKLSRPYVITMGPNHRLVKWNKAKTHIIHYVLEMTINDHEKIKETSNYTEFNIQQFVQGYQYSIRVATVNLAGQGQFSKPLFYSEGEIFRDY